VDVALRDRHAAMTRDLLDSEGVCASFIKPRKRTRDAMSVSCSHLEAANRP